MESQANKQIDIKCKTNKLQSKVKIQQTIRTSAELLPEPTYVPELQIEAKTWLRDSHGLYDYDSTTIAVQNLKVQGSFFCVRSENNISVIPPTTQSEKRLDEIEDPVVLFKGAYKYGNYYLYHSDTLTNEKFDDSSLMVWYIMKSNEIYEKPIKQRDPKHTQRYPLSVGEIVKFGRVSYKIIRIYQPSQQPKEGSQITIFKNKLSLDITQTEGQCEVQQNSKHDEQWDSLQFQSQINMQPEKLNQQNQEMKRPQTPFVCRICLGDDEALTNDNPLISPCKCSGTMSSIHVNCLTEWLSSKRETRASVTTNSFQWTVMDCELCQTKFPDFYIAQNGKKYKIFAYEEPENEAQPFIVFQSMFTQKKVKTIHVVSVAKRNITKIGRAYEIDMRVPDISASRIHAQVVYKNNTFYLEDLQSKFGTMILLQKPFKINEHILKKPLKFQVGRTIFSVELSIKKYKNGKGTLTKLCCCLSKQSQSNKIIKQCSFLIFKFEFSEESLKNEILTYDKELAKQFPIEIRMIMKEEEAEQEKLLTQIRDQLKFEHGDSKYTNPFLNSARITIMPSECEYETARSVNNQSSVFISNGPQLKVFEQKSEKQNEAKERKKGPNRVSSSSVNNPARQAEEEKQGISRPIFSHVHSHPQPNQHLTQRDSMVVEELINSIINDDGRRAQERNANSTRVYLR